MSTLEKAIELLQEMPENKLEAIYMYIRFAYSQPGSDEGISALNKSMDSLMGITHEHINPSSAEKKADTFENAAIEKFAQKSTIEERQRGFQGLMSFAGTLPEDFDYKKELEEARDEKHARFI